MHAPGTGLSLIPVFAATADRINPEFHGCFDAKKAGNGGACVAKLKPAASIRGAGGATAAPGAAEKSIFSAWSKHCASHVATGSHTCRQIAADCAKCELSGCVKRISPSASSVKSRLANTEDER